MEVSILNTVKQTIGLALDYEPFDQNLITYINSAFSTVSQLGIGPEGGFTIEDASATWDDFIFDGGDDMLNMVKNYVSLKAQLLFDPPVMGYLVDLKKEELKQMEFRLTVFRDAEVEDGV